MVAGVFLANPFTGTVRFAAGQEPELRLGAGVAAAATVEARIASSADDAEQAATGAMDLSSSDLELVQETTTQVVGLRWAGLTIPQGATIDAAWIQFTVDEATSEATTLTFRGESSDTAAVFTSTSGNLSSRPPTIASVLWTPNAWTTVGLAGPDQRTPDLKTVIQEIVNRPGWKYRGSLAIIISGTGRRVAESFNGNSLQAAVLHVEYTSTTPPPNEPPVANLTVAQLADPPLTVNASAAGSTDADADPIAAYRFTFGDGTPAVVTTHPTTDAQHTYATHGTYTVTLIATDTGGLQSAPVSRTLNILGPGMGMVEKRIAASADDVEEQASLSVNLSSSDLELTYDGNSQTVGLRWTGLTIPAGATITSAWIQFASTSARSEAASLAFFGEAADAAAAFTSTAGNVSTRPRTTASVAWAPGAWVAGEVGPGERTPDLKDIIQQIVSRDGWVSGNPLAIIVTSTGTGRRVAWSFNGNASLAPLLHVEYSTASGPPPNAPPVANLTLSQVLTPSLDVTASAAGSTDTDFNPIESYRFDFGDGTPAVVTVPPNVTASHSYAAAGTYTVTLIVTDTGGLQSAPVSRQITVAPPTNYPPVANLSVTQAASPALTVNASGAGSTDTDPYPIASYRFNFGDGSAPVVTTAPNSAATHTYAAAGTYTVTLTVTDVGGLESVPVSVAIDVLPPPNQPPVANLGVTQLQNPALTVEASAAGSTDTDADPIASYQFTFGDGTPPVVTTPPTVTATHTYGTAGTYTVTLIATDTGGLQSAPVSRTINVLAPGVVAIEKRIAASSDDVEESATLTVNLSSSDLELVRDANNQTVGLRWTGLTIPQGSTINSAWIQFASRRADSDASSLTIKGEAADAATTFTTASGNVSTRPKTGATVTWAANAWANGAAGPDQRTPELKSIVQEIVSRPGWASGNPLAIIFTGTGRRTAWSFNGSAASAPLLHVEYLTGPPPANDPPVASLTVSQVTEPPLTVNASGAGSTDTDAFPIASYRFTFGDGTPEVVTNAPTAATTHTYASPGTYTVTLIVTDTGGLQSAPVSMTVNVQPPPNQPPVANLTVSQVASPPLTVSASGVGSTDPEGAPIASYRFTFGDGTSPVVTTPPTVAALHTYATTGTYTVTLVVTDAEGLQSAPVSRTITVTPPVITTLETRVPASSDDAEQASSGSVSLSSSDLELTLDGTSQTVGMRWTGVAIPQGATINAAWIQFAARIANSEATTLTFRGQAADAAATFSSTSGNISGRTPTGASVVWTPNAWASGEAGANQRTPELKAIIQEIVNRPGWLSGNPLAMIVTGTGKRTAWSRDGNASLAPLLHVEYLGGSGGPANQPPVASLSVTQVSSPPLTVSASGAGSTDTDNFPIASYRFTFGDGTPAVVTTAPTATASHTYATPGTYTVTLIVTDTGGLQSAPVSRNVTVTAPSPIAVYVGYYDTHHPNLLRPKPNPWMGSSGVTFVGTPDSPSGGWDSSALRIDNLTSQSISNVVVTVDMGSDHFALWGTRSIPAGGKLILAQTGFENFDGSDTSPAGCYGCNPNDCLTKVESTVPVVHVTINGTTTNYYDVDQIMNTKGVDGAGCPYTGTRNDESWPWTQITTNPNAIAAGEEALIATETGERSPEVPEVPVLAMGAPFPNPANEGVVFRFSVASRGRTQLSLYDVAGRRVQSFLDWELEPGRYQRPVDLRDVSPGVYFCELKTTSGTVRTSLVIMR